MGPTAEHAAMRVGDGGDEAAEPPSRPRLEWVDLRSAGGDAAALRLDLAAVAARLEAAPIDLPPGMAEVRLALLDDAAMAGLHRDHCGLDSPTDVLTYPDPDGASGDVAIGVEVAAREAARLGRQLGEEVLLYAVHGLLHLAGERDDSEAAADRMRRRQDEVLAAIGAPPTEPPEVPRERER